MLIGNVIIFPMWFIRQNISGHVILLCRMYIRNYFHKESIWSQSVTCFNDTIPYGTNFVCFLPAGESILTAFILSSSFSPTFPPMVSNISLLNKEVAVKYGTIAKSNKVSRNLDINFLRVNMMVFKFLYVSK